MFYNIGAANVSDAHALPLLYKLLGRPRPPLPPRFRRPWRSLLWWTPKVLNPVLGDLCFNIRLVCFLFWNSLHGFTVFIRPKGMFIWTNFALHPCYARNNILSAFWRRICMQSERCDENSYKGFLKHYTGPTIHLKVFGRIMSLKYVWNYNHVQRQNEHRRFLLPMDRL